MTPPRLTGRRLPPRAIAQRLAQFTEADDLLAYLRERHGDASGPGAAWSARRDLVQALTGGRRTPAARITVAWGPGFLEEHPADLPARSAVERALAFVRGIVAHPVAGHIRFSVGDRRGLYHKDADGPGRDAITLARIAMSEEVGEAPDHGAQAAVHEIGHWLEWRLPGAMAACSAFRRHRTADEPVVQLSERFPGYGFTTEAAPRLGRGEPPEMRDWYAGVSWPTGGEVLSVGMELLWEPQAFAGRDGEWMKLVLAVLVGALN